MMRDGFYDAGSITGYTCPEGWEQIANDESNGTCTAPCFPPGNDSPQSFAYGPNSGGFPLNRRSGWDYCVDSNNNNQAAAFSVRSATVGGPPIEDKPPAPPMEQPAPPPMEQPAPPPPPMPMEQPAPPPMPVATYICPPGWSQVPTDAMNGSCSAPCFPPGNDSPQSFEYGPNAGGYPLNQLSGSDYCTESYNSNQSAAFSMKSATVGGYPIIGPIDSPAPKPVPKPETAPMPVATATEYTAPVAAPVPVAKPVAPPAPVAAPVVQVPMTVSKPASINAPTMMTPMAAPAAKVAAVAYTCPEGFKQARTNALNGTCTAPCIPGNASPKSFSYGPKAGGYPLTKMSGKSYCSASKFSNMKATFKSRSATVGGPAIEGYEDLNSADEVQSSCPSLSPRAAAAAAEVEASTVEMTTKIKDIASRAAEVMADKMNRDTIPGLNITCPSGDKPKISYIRNSKFAKGPTDVNTLKGVRGNKSELSCSEPKHNQYIFNPQTEY